MINFIKIFVSLVGRNKSRMKNLRVKMDSFVEEQLQQPADNSCGHIRATRVRPSIQMSFTHEKLKLGGKTMHA